MTEPQFLGDHALRTPDKPALINGTTGAVLTYRDIDERSNRLAQCLYALGLRQGDRIAIVMENNMRYLEVCWAALRSGLGHDAAQGARAEGGVRIVGKEGAEVCRTAFVEQAAGKSVQPGRSRRV